MYDARQIANWFIRRATSDGHSLSIMQLLKLVYIAHGWHLEITKTPLFRNKIEAWQHGPVIPDVYRSFRPQGVTVVQVAPEFPVDVPQRIADFLEEVYRIYGKRSPFHLSEITHVKGGPWETVIKKNGRFAHIPDELILSHYVSLREKRSSSSRMN